MKIQILVNLVKKELEIINKLIANPKYEDELLKSDDNVEVYLALWNKSARDIKRSCWSYGETFKIL